MNEKKNANPAVVGLAGFALTTMVLQFHNLGWCGLGPVIVLGIFFGGVAQLIAGFAEQKMGNNFGFSAFVAYGSFWLGLVAILLLNHFGIYQSSTTDIGWYLAAWMLYSLIMTICALRIHTAMVITLFSLFLGFLLLVIAHFTDPVSARIWTMIAAYELIFCAGSAMYMMIGIVINDQAGKAVIPFGKPWIKA